MRKYAVLALIVILALAIGGCAPFSPAPPTKAILEGRVVVPEGAVRQVGGQPLPGATVRVKDLEGNIVATTTTDANGYYRVEVPAGGPYIIEVVKGSIKVLDISPQVEAGETYDLKTADATSTAVALVFQAKVEAGEDPAEIDLDELAEDPKIKEELAQAIEEALAAGEDPTTAPEVIRLVDVIMTPPAPKPTPKPTPKPDTTPPTLKSLTAYIGETPVPATKVGEQWTLEWTVGETVTKIEAIASEPITLAVDLADAVVRMSGEGWDPKTGNVVEIDAVYGTITVDETDPTKTRLIITPNPGNETAGLEGTFTFTVAEGVVEDLAGNPNAEISVILKVTVEIIEAEFGTASNFFIEQLLFWVEDNCFAQAPDGFYLTHDLVENYSNWSKDSWHGLLSEDRRYAQAYGDAIFPGEMTGFYNIPGAAEVAEFRYTMYFPNTGSDFTFYIGVIGHGISGEPYSTGEGSLNYVHGRKYTAATGEWTEVTVSYDADRFPITDLRQSIP